MIVFTMRSSNSMQQTALRTDADASVYSKEHK